MLCDLSGLGERSAAAEYGGEKNVVYQVDIAAAVTIVCSQKLPV